ncbi:HNH endonuclease [Clostridium sp. YIM B02555]|uniref:HNH endonuclease n=1 Tax=Clostridium sp. YIM B02555 TaxID=2911968 RepID=UPI001EEF480C
MHHIKWLSRGGEDSIENTAALCPNCHRRMHIVDSNEDREKLILIINLKNI